MKVWLVGAGPGEVCRRRLGGDGALERRGLGQVRIALQRRHAALAVRIEVGGDVALLALHVLAVLLQVIGRCAFERVAQPQRRTHAPADHHVFLGHLQLSPGLDRGVQALRLYGQLLRVSPRAQSGQGRMSRARAFSATCCR